MSGVGGKNPREGGDHLTNTRHPGAPGVVKNRYLTASGQLICGELDFFFHI